MKRKHIIIIIASSILLPVVFTAMLIGMGIRLIDGLDDDYICDEENVIKEVLVDCKIRIPETATNLYYSHDYGLDIHSLIALTLSSNEESEEFLKTWLKAPIEEFHKTTELPLGHIPGEKWLEEHQRWDILDYDEYYIYEDTQNLRCIEIVYIPKHFRIFIMITHV